MMYRFGLLFSLTFLFGCASQSTRVYEKHKGLAQSFDESVDRLRSASESPLRIADETVVLDTRLAFDHSMSRIPGAQLLDWKEFAKTGSKYPGHIKEDTFQLTRRLARLGIRPESEVIIVGQGAGSKGANGRLAWTLFYLGVDNVNFASIDYFDQVQLTAIDKTKPRQPVPIWKPRLREQLVVQRSELMEVVNGEVYRKGQRVFVIDVRSQNEFFNKDGFGGGYQTPNIQSFHIPYEEFFDERGRPNLALKQRLSGVGIHPEDRVIILSNKGVRSAAVNMALLSLGYKKAAHFPGGFPELLDQ